MLSNGNVRTLIGGDAANPSARLARHGDLIGRTLYGDGVEHDGLSFSLSVPSV